MAPTARALLLLLALVAISRPAAAAASTAGQLVGWELGAVVGDEWGLGDTVARRVLQSGGYISYGALRRDNVPCSVRGASYYNCRPGGQANPYTRGCSAITQCRG
jgi:hypothetical protein